ncbi:MAG: CHAD domain-containing protein [Trueperaceae bacterium]
MTMNNSISIVVKQLGTQLLNKVNEQTQGLSAEDQETLHDFRVSVRRLRSFLKSYEPYLKAKKHRQRFADIMDVTSKGRDFDVHIVWLRNQKTKADDTESVGITYLLEQLVNTKTLDLEKVQNATTKAAEKLAVIFSRAVSTQETTKSKTKEETFATVTAQVLQAHSKDFRELLREIAKPTDDVIHEARIAAKRLRYTLELLGESETKSFLKKLKGFQDITGNLHDLQVLEPKVQKFLHAETVLWSQTVQNKATTFSQNELRRLPELQRSYGLAAVAKRLEEEKLDLYNELQNSWLGEASTTFFKDLHDFIEGFSKPSETTEATSKPHEAKKVNKARKGNETKKVNKAKTINKTALKTTRPSRAKKQS